MSIFMSLDGMPPRVGNNHFKLQEVISSASFISVHRIELAIQSLAESRVNSWAAVACPGVQTHNKRHSKSRRSKSSLSEAAPVEQEGFSDSFWLYLTALMYVIPANLCLLGSLLMRKHAVLILLAWIVAEATFAFLRYFEFKRIDNLIIQNPSPSTEEADDLFERILNLRVIEPKSFLSRWFLGAPVEKILRGNIAEFLSFSFYHRSFGDLSELNQLAVIDQVSRLEDAWDLSFEDGLDPLVPFMAHTREPLRTVHHPLTLYLWAQSVASLTSVAMRALGFDRHTSSIANIHYWEKSIISLADNDQKRAPARIFVHGLGIGITPYLGFIEMLSRDYNGRVIVMELPHIAMRLQKGAIPTADDLVLAIEEMHRRLNISSAQYIGHSYGSMVIARLVRKSPHLVSSLALLDPVCFLLCLPDVVYNFVYRLPEGDRLVSKFCDAMRWFFVSREVQVAQVLCRGFDWHTVHLWVDQMPCKAVVFLSGRDQIVPSENVKIYLEQNRVKVMYKKDFHHAEFLFRPSIQREFLQVVSSMEGN